MVCGCEVVAGRWRCGWASFRIGGCCGAVTVVRGEEVIDGEGVGHVVGGGCGIGDAGVVTAGAELGGDCAETTAGR